MQFFPFGFEKGNGVGSKELLGGKGAGLVWLASEGVPVPPGFVIPTTVWEQYDQKPKTTMKEIAKTLPEYLTKLEAHFGYMPLVSVRSGARVSCPGMMDTVLNVGIDGATCTDWIGRLGPTCFGDSHLRLVQMYGSIVDGLDKDSLGPTLKDALDRYQAQTGHEFPQAKAQLLGAIEAVFKSWDNERAVFYRRREHIPREWGTAVTIQTMVFGNKNDQSGTGVLFTRNPDTGGMLVTGEWMVNAQGEDIVAGDKTPLPLNAMLDWNPKVHDQLLDQVIKLENLQKDALDIEFTVQDGILYLLQVRAAKRTPLAALKIALDMVKQGLIDSKTAVKRITPQQFDRAQMPSLDPKFTKKPAFTGIPAASGVVTGKPVFSKQDAIKCKEPCILVANETIPDDIAGMAAAVGIVTMVGGMTSHAAVNARNMNRPCIVGVGSTLEAFKDIEVLSLDGATGRIWTEKVPIVAATTNGVVRAFSQLVTDTLQIVPVIFKAPEATMPEALLYLGDQILNPEAAAKTVLASLKKVTRLYLDLVPSDEEMRFLSILSAHNHTDVVLDLLHQAIPEFHEDFNRLVLIAKAEQKSEFTRVASSATLRSIVLSESEIIMDGIDQTDPAVKKVLAWKQADGGLKAISIGKYVPGSKSMISIPQAMQILREGV